MDDIIKEEVQKVSQEQIHNLLFGDQLSWQAIIHDLINTEQLDPWDIDISLLSQRFLEKVRMLEEANFFVSSKVLLAAAILLRMKSEILLEQDLPNLDAILFGQKDQKKQDSYKTERIELDDEIPELIARTPLPRFRKVTLDELMKALGQAITTENRRIKRIVVARQQEFEIAIAMPKSIINLKEKLKEIYQRLRTIFSQRKNKLPFSEFAGKSSDEKISAFIPLLHLDHQQKVWLEQNGHFEEIWISLKDMYEKENAEKLERLLKEAEDETQENPKSKNL